MNFKRILKYIALVLILFVPTFFTIDYVLSSKIDSLRNNKYTAVSKNLKNLTHQLIDVKSYATLNIAIALSENNSYKKFLLGDKTEVLNLKEISLKTKNNSNFKNIWIHLVDANGISQYRSWTKKRGDSLLKVRKELIPLLKKPKITSVISVGIFDLTFKSIVPIYNQDKFLGFIEVITKINSIARKLKEDGIDLVVLVDKKYKQQIKKPFTKLFIDNYYVANTNTRSDLRDIVKKDIDKFISKKEYHIINDKYFTTTLFLNDFNNKEMAYIIIFKDYKSLYLDGINDFEQFIKIIGILITITIIALFSTYYYFNKSKYTRKLEEKVKQRTKELDISIKKYKQIFEGSKAIKILVDPDTLEIFDANKAALEFYGYTKEQMKKLKSTDINISINKDSKVFCQILNNEKNIFIFKHKLSNKQIKDVEVYSSAIDINNKKYIYSIIRDITESLKIKKDYEDKQKLFYQQAKMASMGEMLENIAHQWRQPLSTITTASSGIKIKKEFDSLDDVFFNDSLDIILKSANFLSQTIEDFRNFFKHSEIIEEFSTIDVLEDSLNILKLKLQSNNIKVDIQNKTQEKLQGYKNELIQVFLNILNNSVDAFKTSDVENKLIQIIIYTKNNYICIDIQDNASGIDEEIIEKIFEPYFTTKHKSQGTGIGLYMSEQIIEKHFDGKIIVKNSNFQCNSKEFYGANFKILLPLNV
ncbi:MAG: ATP-binding protein [Halarcobacter sp.]